MLCSPRLVYFSRIDLENVSFPWLQTVGDANVKEFIDASLFVKNSSELLLNRLDAFTNNVLNEVVDVNGRAFDISIAALNLIGMISPFISYSQLELLTLTICMSILTSFRRI